METTNKIAYQELIYASTEKNMDSGMPGFGVRTYTEGMNTELVRQISDCGVCNYEVDYDKALMYDQLVQNPNVVWDYPQTYEFRKLDLGEGRVKYIFSRSVYIAVDYGHFCGGGAIRTGSNFISHVLVFDQYPGTGIFRVIAENGCFNKQFFLPLDYTCQPDNPELKRLLTGEPVALTPKFVDGMQKTRIDEIMPELGEIVVGLFELAFLKKEQQEEEGSLKKQLIVRASDELTGQLVADALTLLPLGLSGEICFATNHRKAGVPEGIDVVFVNENYSGNLYEEDYLFVDVMEHKSMNIRSNRLYDWIRKYASREVQTFQEILKFLENLELDAKTDLDFIFQLYQWSSKNNKERNLPNAAFIQKLYLMRENDLLRMVKKNIEQQIYESLKSANVEEVEQAIVCWRNLVANAPSLKRELNQQTKSCFTRQILSDIEVWKRIVKEENADVLIDLLDRTAMEEGKLFCFLKKTASWKMWADMIRFYEGEKLSKKERVFFVLENILQSSLTEDEREKLLEVLLNGHSVSKDSILYHFALGNPQYLKIFGNSVRQVALQQGEAIWGELLQKVENKEYRVLVRGWVLQYYKERFEESVEGAQILKAVSELVSLLALESTLMKDLGGKEVCQLLIERLKGVSTVFSDQEIKLLEQFDFVEWCGGDRRLISQWNNLIALLHEEMIKEPAMEDLKFVLKQKKRKLFIGLLQEMLKHERFSLIDLVELMKEKSELGERGIQKLMLVIWESKVRQREDLIKEIVKQVGWSKQEMNVFIESEVKDQDLKKLLEQQNSLGTRLLRFLFKK